MCVYKALESAFTVHTLKFIKTVVKKKKTYVGQDLGVVTGGHGSSHNNMQARHLINAVSCLKNLQLKFSTLKVE